MLLPGLCFFLGLAGNLSSSLIITGTLYIAIVVPFLKRFTFNELRGSGKLIVPDSGSRKDLFIPKTVEVLIYPWHFGQ
jgi:hypothetical protein